MKSTKTVSFECIDVLISQPLGKKPRQKRLLAVACQFNSVIGRYFSDFANLFQARCLPEPHPHQDPELFVLALRETVLQTISSRCCKKFFNRSCLGKLGLIAPYPNSLMKEYKDLGKCH